MSNIEKRALDLLCGECDLDPEDYCRGLRVNADEALKAIVAALTPPDAYVRAVDHELVTAEIGVANHDDSFEGASQNLHDLIMWHVQVATDPAVNGGFVLVPVEPTEEMAQATVYNGIDYTHAFDMEDFRRDYAAMLAARPEVK